MPIAPRTFAKGHLKVAQGRPGKFQSPFLRVPGGALKPTSDSDPPGGGQKLDFGQPSDGLGRSQGGAGAALGARFGGPFVPQKRSESQERSQRPPRGPPKGQVHFKKGTQSRPGGFWRDFLGAFEGVSFLHLFRGGPQESPGAARASKRSCFGINFNDTSG